MIKRLVVSSLALTLLASSMTVADAKLFQKHKKQALEVTDTSDATFERDVLQASQPVMVDFYATWCGPCRLMAPVVDGLASQYKANLKVYRMDIDKNPRIARQLKIQSIPMFVIWKDGKQVSSTVGTIPKEQLGAIIEKSIQL